MKIVAVKRFNRLVSRKLFGHRDKDIHHNNFHLDSIIYSSPQYDDGNDLSLFFRDLLMAYDVIHYDLVLAIGSL